VPAVTRRSYPSDHHRASLRERRGRALDIGHPEIAEPMRSRAASQRLLVQRPNHGAVVTQDFCVKRPRSFGIGRTQ
jgi:hypothetical protein